MLLLCQTLTSLEKEQVTAGENYHLDKSSLIGLSQTGPPQEEEGKGEETQRH
jgi:hypothetical protein